MDIDSYLGHRYNISKILIRSTEQTRLKESKDDFLENIDTEPYPSVGTQSSRSQIQGPLLNNQPFWTGNIYERTQLPNGTAEAGRYFLEAQTGETVDPIEFWKAHHKAYPCLSQVVRTVMAAPVTSTPPERAFSKTSLIFQHAIGSLSAQQLYVLISWLKNGR